VLQFAWFEEDEEDHLNDAQRVFLTALRTRADTWPCSPLDTQLVAPGDGCPHWRAVLDVSAQIEKLSLITIGVCFDGTRIWGGELHNQSYEPWPTERPRVEVIDATGTPEDLAQIAAEWFERVLARPVERREWSSGERVTYEYAFSDTGTGLVRGGAGAPGTVRRPPDRIIHARGTSDYAAG
jgi:hypothetical protein